MKSKKFIFAIISIVAVIIISWTYFADYLLIASCSNGNVRMTNVLLKMGIDPNTNRVDQGNALIQAAYHDHVKVVRLLLQHGADPNSHVSGGETALMYACYHASPSMVELLLDAGANPSLNDGNSQSAYTYAEGRLEIIDLLKQRQRQFPAKH